jgi:NADPH2:quinone reductase
MKAIVAERSGGPEVLRLTEMPVPELKPHQVLVQLKAVGINR